MPIFTEIADQWRIADASFAALEAAAFQANDDANFDLASEQRKRNDQAYFLYMFTRFEDSVNQAVKTILQNRIGAAAWADRRVWESWSRQGVEDTHFMAKVEILTDKTLHEYGNVKRYYDRRNDIAHGGIWAEQFVIPAIAQHMENLLQAFPQN